MKKLLPFVTFLFCTTLITAQTYERTDDRGFDTSVERVHALEDGSWVSLIRFGAFGFYGDDGGVVQYFDANNELQWEVEDPTYPHLPAKELLITEEGNIAFLSSGSGCDVSLGLPFKATVVNAGGDVLFDNLFSVNIDDFDSELMGCVADSILFVASSYYDDNGSTTFPSQVNGLSSSLDSLWTLYLTDPNIDRIARQGDYAVVFAENKLLRIDGEGNKVDSLELTEPPLHVTPVGENTLLLSFNDGVYELDGVLNLNQVITYPELEVPQHILWASNEIHLSYPNEIYVYNDAFDWVETILPNVLPGFQIRDVALNGNSYITVGNRPFTTTFNYHFNGTQDFGTSSGAFQFVPAEDDVPVQSPDAALRHLNLSDYFASGVAGSHIVNATFFLVNEGDVDLDSVQINFAGNLNPISCGINGATRNYTNLDLAPGDSIMLTWEELHYGYYYFMHPEDSGQVEYCIYATQPNRLYDRVPGNDQVCGIVQTGVGINELLDLEFSIFPNPTNEILRWNCINCDIADGTLQFISTSGKMIEEISISGHASTVVDVSDWSSGIYMARITSNGKVSEPVKFTVQH